MNYPDYPPPGVFIPSQLIFHPELPPAMLVTWIQLRSLAREGLATSPLSMSQLAAQLGIHPARLYKHMAHLQEIAALSWQAGAGEKIIISFPAQPVPVEEQAPIAAHQPISTSPKPMLKVNAAPANYFPARILGYISYEDDEMDPLQVELDMEDSAGIERGRPINISKLAACRPAEPAFAAK